MTSKDKITEIAGLLLTKINKELSQQEANENGNLCTLVEATVVKRLDNGSETGRIAEEIMRVMFPNKKNRSMVTVDYNEKTLTVKAIIDLKKE